MFSGSVPGISPWTVFSYMDSALTVLVMQAGFFSMSPRALIAGNLIATGNQTRYLTINQ